MGRYHFQARRRLEVLCSVVTRATEHNTLPMAAKSCGAVLWVCTISYLLKKGINLSRLMGLYTLLPIDK